MVSGGYVDDLDYGNEIIYTGQGGNDPNTKRQIADQKLTLGNAGLARNQLEGNPVRVIRGAGGDPAWSPTSGFRYDGLFRVADHWHEIGKDRFRIWRFRLVALESADQPPTGDSDSAGTVGRTETVIQRLIRSTVVANSVKQLHGYRCQVCGLRLETPAGPYVEAAHIRALGRPHNGPDVPANVLCLCPNHHVLFDAGAIIVDVDGVARETTTGRQVGRLQTVRRHQIDWSQIAYHREGHQR